MGSNVTEYEIDWLYRSRRIPEGVTCRLPGDEIEPELEPGEHVVFLAHFERGFGLPASPFFQKFLDFYELQPHHLPGHPCAQAPVSAGLASSAPSGSPKFAGLESCRAWQGTFFYVKNSGTADLIDLPPFNPVPPSKANWSYNPRSGHTETNRVVCHMANLMKETNICSDDIIRTFISRRVLPLKRRQHKMSEMYGPGDPTKITGLPLSKRDVVRKAKQICQTAMPDDWEWGLLPFSTTNPPTQEVKDRFPSIHAERRSPCVKRALDSVDPDPFIRWLDLKMGKTKASRLGPSVPKPTGSADDLTILEVHEHVPPLQAEAGHEFVEKLTAQGQKNKAPASDAGSSEAPPSKRFRTEPLGQKEVGMRRYKRKQMPTSSGYREDLNSSSLKPGTIRCRHHRPLSGALLRRAAPTPPDRAERTLSPSGVHAGARNIGAEEEDAGQAEPLVPPVPKRKKKTRAPETSVPGGSKSGEAPSAPLSPRTAPTPPPVAPRIEATGGTSTPPPPKTSKLVKAKATASNVSSGGPQPLVLHASRAASAASERATGLLGWITEFQRQGWELGHLLPYAEKWNAADMSPATRGIGKDRLPLPDPAGDRSSEEHFMRLRRAVKELDSAWYDATNNLMHTADARKVLFEELLWEHQELAEAHDKCQEEKDQLTRQHQEELSTQRTSYQELKGQLIQLGFDHAAALKAAETAAAAKLHEALEDAGNSTAVLQAELEELAKVRKAAEDKAARLEAGQKEYD
ncbi:hypothetical protein QYE76_046782 [Lolium multiflorum]|uniref:Transposase (putative) gypsy type domain-containing protein n=1 Tax=Lolium multiflorum TaxID=4521 RepID=A0AAD8TQI9_LOLMU|nr:hypothetical protein QYE76_046782 [Lolium multiflorum]